MRFCTIIASNYLAYARVLAASVRANHPDARFSLLLIDPEPVDLRPEDAFEILRPADIGLGGEEFLHMAAIYSVVELATAVKPTLLTSLLDAHHETVCYLDPDIELFSPLEGLDQLVERHGMALTPHTTTAIPRDGKLMGERTLLLAGMYNLGFIAVGERARPFLAWWTDRLRRDCQVAVEQGLFVDQRWVDVATCCFDHASITDPGWNVAYWNLHGRSVAHGPDGYVVDGHPLRFFHFSGFSPLEPCRLSRYQGDAPRIRLVDHPAVAQLCARYASKLLAAGYLVSVSRPYHFDYTATGLPFDARMRHIYRVALEAAELDREPKPPNPFAEATAAEFLDWLCLPSGPSGIQRVPRYIRRIHDERADLQVHFPDLSGPKGDQFLEFMRVYGESNTGLPPWCSRDPRRMPEWPPSPVAGQPVRPGVNVVGYLNAENGVGEVARLLIEALGHAAIPASGISWDQTPARQGHAFDSRATPSAHEVNVICVNADQLRRLPGSTVVMPPASRTVGVWAWEVASVPDWMRRSEALVDEVWTYSRHSADALAALVDVPVHVFAPPIPVVAPPIVDRAAMGLPAGFLFLFCFDHFSVFERKNPLGVIQAFCMAFAPGDGPRLIVKAVNGRSFPIEAAKLHAAAAGRPDVTIVDDYFDRERQAALMAACDAYVSLHRAEGYGLTMAEAMALGKPVIATAYSGNLEFMTPDNSRLVPYGMAAIPLGCMPYPLGGEWADPDLEVASLMMREMAEDPDSATRLGACAREDVRRNHSPAARVRFLQERLLPMVAQAS